MPANSIVVAQQFVTSWTKRSRGSPVAAQRNSVPEHALLPRLTTAHWPICIAHFIQYGVANNFAAPIAETVETPSLWPFALGCVGLYRETDAIRIVFEGTYNPRTAPDILIGYGDLGAPRRTVPLCPFTLRLNEWGQLRFLGRFTEGWQGLQMYRKQVYNIGWFTAYSPDIFVETKPRHRYESMPNVW